MIPSYHRCRAPTSMKFAGKVSLPWARSIPTADQLGVRNGVGRRAEGPLAHKGRIGGQHVGDGVVARDVEGLIEGQGRETRRERAR